MTEANENRLLQTMESIEAALRVQALDTLLNVRYGDQRRDLQEKYFYFKKRTQEQIEETNKAEEAGSEHAKALRRLVGEYMAEQRAFERDHPLIDALCSKIGEFASPRPWGLTK